MGTGSHPHDTLLTCLRVHSSFESVVMSSPSPDLLEPLNKYHSQLEILRRKGLQSIWPVRTAVGRPTMTGNPRNQSTRVITFLLTGPRSCGRAGDRTQNRTSKSKDLRALSLSQQSPWEQHLISFLKRSSKLSSGFRVRCWNGVTAW